LVDSNQHNYFENAKACSKRTLKTTVATQLKSQSCNCTSGFVKPACVLIFSGAFFKSYKKFKCHDFLPGAQKKLPALGHLWVYFGLKLQERVTNKRLDLGQASEGT